MLSYLLAILGLAAMCAIWMMVQLWIANDDPNRANSGMCCGACTSDCKRDPQEQKEVT